MNTVLLTLAVLLVILVLLLAVPIELVFDVTRIDRFSTNVKVKWLFGLIRFSVNKPDTSAAQPKETTKAETMIKTKQQKTTTSSSNLIAALKQSAFRRRVYRFVKDLLRATHSRDIFLRLRIGLGDPADTGRLWIFLGPVAAIAANAGDAVIRIEPEFINPTFEIDGRGAFRLMPLEFITLVIAFMLSPTTLRAWRTLRRGSY
jgi:hypothetical protein